MNGFENVVDGITMEEGIEIAKIDASAHEISGEYPNQPSSIWLVVLLEGVAEFFDGHETHDEETRPHDGRQDVGPIIFPATASVVFLG